MNRKINFDTVILAAGLGVRMKSAYPKVIHKICDKPILWWVVRSAILAGTSSVTIVTRRDFHNEIKSAVLSSCRDIAGNDVEFNFVVQKKQLGSGDALKAGLSGSKKSGYVLVLSGDAPLIKPETVKNFVLSSFSVSGGAGIAAVLTAYLENPSGYGRIVRNSPDGDFLKIVEEKDARLEEKEIKEINVGTYFFDRKNLLPALERIKPYNAKKEYYITDVFEVMRSESSGFSSGVKAFPLAAPSEAPGINNRRELAEAERILQRRINEELMLESGVTFIDPASAYIGPDVKIGQDTTIYPSVTIKGRTIIGRGCVIGSGSYIKGSRIGNSVKIRSSYIYESVISDDVLIGPFAHIRPGTTILNGSRVGNFTEIKKSFVGKNTKISHLAYIGDAELAGDINVGAGAITCNYDGIKKHKTTIGRGSFVGSNVNLVAPVTVGKNVLIGAGSTITKDIPDNTLAIERSTQIHKPNKRLK